MENGIEMVERRRFESEEGRRTNVEPNTGDDKEERLFEAVLEGRDEDVRSLIKKGPMLTKSTKGNKQR